MNKTALVVIDMLKEFFVPKEKLPAPTRIKEIAKNNRKVVLKAREVGIPVIFNQDSFQKTEVAIDRHFKLFGVHAVEGTESAQIIDELEYDPERDFIVGKKLYDGFFNTRMDSILRELDLKKCVFTGTWTNACVQHTVMGAWCRCYDVTLLRDCCAAPDEESHEYALEYMKKFYAADIIDSDTWISRVEGK